MTLNSGLDMFSEDNQISDNVHIGLTKNTRTSDQMFIMKSLIGKSININDGKLTSGFVDFWKAFDSVIHPVCKAKELNINGKFYDILCSLYTKSSVCIRVREHHTDHFV